MKAIHEAGIVSALLAYTALAAGCAAAGPVGDFDRANSDAEPVPLALALAGVPVSADVSANGSGCPSGSWTADVSDSGSSVSLSFYSHEASSGSGGSTSARSECAIRVRLNGSQGVSYAVSRFAYDGNAGLDADVRGSQVAQYNFQGSPASEGGRTDLVGPYADDFEYHDTLRPSELVWSPCGTNGVLSVSTRIQVSNGSGDMSVDNLRIGLNQRGC